MNTKWCITSL